MNALHKKVVLKASKVRTGGTLRGILNWLLGLENGIPVSVTSDGFLIGKDENLHDVFLGSADNLSRNLSGFAEAAGLSIAEENYLWSLAHEKVIDWRVKAEFQSAYLQRKPQFSFVVEG